MSDLKDVKSEQPQHLEHVSSTPSSENGAAEEDWSDINEQKVRRASSALRACLPFSSWPSRLMFFVSDVAHASNRSPSHPLAVCLLPTLLPRCVYSVLPMDSRKASSSVADDPFPLLLCRPYRSSEFPHLLSVLWQDQPTDSEVEAASGRHRSTV
jgi:hypothetical protein